MNLKQNHSDFTKSFSKLLVRIKLPEHPPEILSCYSVQNSSLEMSSNLSTNFFFHELILH